MTKRRELTRDQREAKNERDRQMRLKKKMEVKRLRQVEADFEVLRNAYGEIREEYERLNSELPQLIDTIRQLRQQNSQLQEALNQQNSQIQEALNQQNPQLQEALNEVDSWINLDDPNPNVEVDTFNPAAAD